MSPVVRVAGARRRAAGARLVRRLPGSSLADRHLGGSEHLARHLVPGAVDLLDGLRGLVAVDPHDDLVDPRVDLVARAWLDPRDVLVVEDPVERLERGLDPRRRPVTPPARDCRERREAGPPGPRWPAPGSAPRAPSPAACSSGSPPATASGGTRARRSVPPAQRARPRGPRLRPAPRRPPWRAPRRVWRPGRRARRRRLPRPPTRRRPRRPRNPRRPCPYGRGS